MKLTDIIAKKIISDKIPVLEILTHLQEISTYCENELKPYFADYGVEIILFNIISIAALSSLSNFITASNLE